MRPISRARLAVVALFALPMSQLGHLLTYGLRFGPDALTRQATGAHAYLPGLLQACLSVTGGGLLAILLLVALGRFMVGLRNERMPEGGWPAVPLIVTMLGLQLGIFVVQELVEASVLGLAASPPPTLVGWGLAGQLPVAILAGFGLAWLSSRVRTAVRRIRRAQPGLAPPRALEPAPAWAVHPADGPTSWRPFDTHLRGPPRPTSVQL